MTAFSEKDLYLPSLDWTLLQNGWINLYRKPEILEKDMDWLVEYGYKIYRVKCGHWSSKEVALKDLGIVLDFPDYYGHNLDAFNDCLSDLEVPADTGAVIVLLRYDRFAEVDSELAHQILDIIADNARLFMLFGQRLVTLAQTNDPNLSFAPVGSTSVDWNRHEWLIKNR